LGFMDAHLSPNKKTLTVLSPPNNRVYPPGPGNSIYPLPSCQFDDDFLLVAFIFLTIDDITSEGAMVMVGNGASPPVLDQGLRI